MISSGRPFRIGEIIFSLQWVDTITKVFNIFTPSAGCGIMRKDLKGVTLLQVITTHLNADFDALASLVAATKLYPEAQAVLPNSLSRNVQEYVSLYKDLLPVKTVKELDLAEMKLLVLQMPASAVGLLAALLDELTEIHLYDHHPASDDDLVEQYMVVDNVGATVTLSGKNIAGRA